MRNNKILKCILKWMPLYLVMLLLMFVHRYISSLTGLFIGEILGVFNEDNSILPSIISRFVNSESVESKITSLAVIYVIVSAIGVFMDFASRTLRNLHFQKLYVSLSKEFYEHVLDIPKCEYSNRSTGDIIQRNIEDCKRIPGLFRSSLYELFKIFFTASTLLYQLYLLNKTIFVVSLVSLVVCMAFSGYYGYFKIKKNEIQSSKYYSQLNSTIQQSITNYSLVKSFANEDYEYEKFKEINDKKENNNYYINNLHCRYWLISDMITSFYIVGCMAILAYLFFNGFVTLAVVSAVAVIVASFLNSGTQLINHITTFVRTFISVKRLNEYFKIEVEYKND